MTHLLLLILCVCVLLLRCFAVSCVVRAFVCVNVSVCVHEDAEVLTIFFQFYIFISPTGGSIKDRAAKNLILQAEASGQIKRGKSCIVEATGGNTGIIIFITYTVRCKIEKKRKKFALFLIEKFAIILITHAPFHNIFKAWASAWLPTCLAIAVSSRCPTVSRGTRSGSCSCWAPRCICSRWLRLPTLSTCACV